MILRSKPDSRLAAELHLASIDAAEAEDEAKVKKMAVAGGAASVAVGIACVAGMLLAKR